LFIKKLFDVELTYYASSLSFYTIFTIIPFLLIVLWIMTTTPTFTDYYDSVKDFILSNMLPLHSEAVTGYIDGFLKNSVKLGVIGIVAIIIASLLFFDSFEHIVSKIFHVKQRSIWESITTYWTLLTLTPLGLGAFFFLTAKFRLYLNDHAMNTWINLMSYLPHLIIWLLLFIVFVISANTKINKKAAAITSFFTTMAWTLTKSLFVYYVFYNQTYATIYGSFSIVMFFFLWIYVTWIIVVYGLKLCYMIDRVYKYRERKQRQQP